MHSRWAMARGGQYYRKNYRQPIYRHFVKLLANCRYRKKYIWRLSKNYQYQKMCIQFHPIKSNWKALFQKQKKSVSHPRRIRNLLWKQCTELRSNTRWTTWIVKYVNSFHSECDSHFVAKPDFEGNLIHLQEESHRHYWFMNRYAIVVVVTTLIIENKIIQSLTLPIVYHIF